MDSFVCQKFACILQMAFNFWCKKNKIERPASSVFKYSAKMIYCINLCYVQFQENFCEDMMTAPFDKYAEDNGTICLEYKYGDYKNGKSEIIWRVLDTEKWYSIRYGGSSPFAMWWCSVSDEVEEGDDEESDNDSHSSGSSAHLCYECDREGRDSSCKECNGLFCKNCYIEIDEDNVICKTCSNSDPTRYHLNSKISKEICVE